MKITTALLLTACLFAGLSVPPVHSEQKAATIQPFNGKDLTGWLYRGDKDKSKWTVGTAKQSAENPMELTAVPAGTELINLGHPGVDAYTEAKYGDCIIELEFMIPKGSNSGVYVMGEYEIQIIDSFGKTGDLKPGDLGGLYITAAPLVNASLAPGEWQKFVIDFRAPKFDADGKKTANAKFVKVLLNDKLIHENVEMKGVTPSGVTGKEAATGPLMFQGNHGPVAFRNIKIKPLR